MSRNTWDDRPSRDWMLWSFSFLFHLCLILIIGGLAEFRSLPARSPDDRVIGVALQHSLVAREEISPELLDPPEPAQDARQNLPSHSSSSQSSAYSDAESSSSTSLDLVGLDAALEQLLEGDAPSANSGALSKLSNLNSEAVLVDQNKRLQLDGEPGSASLFGLTGTGHRFVYVVDRSDSMNSIGGRPLRAAKRELKKSLQSLTEKQQFQIIFYNDAPKRYIEPGSHLQLLMGERSSVAAAERYIDTLAAFGGTEHMAALKMALRMGPDVIFFLTDARVPELNAAQLEELHRMAERSGTTIFCIEFGTDGAAPQQSFLKQLASDNGGKYQYLDISSL